jgi:hypothetical protein
MKQASTLEIVWRNPRPPHRRQRWEQTRHDSNTTHYLIRELVSTAAGPYWLITTNLELVSGDRVA